MSQPVEALPNVTDQPSNIPERLEAILLALSNYHQALLQEYSLRSQSPNELMGIKTLLADKANIIEHFILFGELPTGIQIDQGLQDCLHRLQENIQPWNPQTTTLSRHWCKLMFEQYPFTVNHKHIQQLLANSLQEIESDGSTPQSDEDDEES